MKKSLRKRLPWLKRYVSWPLEGLLAHGAHTLAGWLPVDRASAIGGWLGRSIGPHVPPSGLARRNLRLAFPEKSEDEIAAILKGCWDNLGRTLMEFPHLPRFRIFEDTARFQVEGAEIIDHLRDDNQPAILIGAHLANWELVPPTAIQRGITTRVFFRPPNNPWVRDLFQKRLHGEGSGLLEKSGQGGREALSYLKKGGHLGLIVDQRLSNGIAVPFFGRPAMTGPIAARFALRFRCPLVPTQVIREKGCRFRIIFHPPMDLPDSGDMESDVLETMTRINALFEAWIRDHPDQWFWLHNRWKGARSHLEAGSPRGQ